MSTSDPANPPPVSELPLPVDGRWRPLRAGLQNLWQYDHLSRCVVGSACDVGGHIRECYDV